MTDQPFVMFTIYKNPSDYPDRYVVRRSRIEPGFIIMDDEPLAVVDSLGAARMAIRDTHRAGLVCMPALPDDEPQIVETWL